MVWEEERSRLLLLLGPENYPPSSGAALSSTISPSNSSKGDLGERLLTKRRLGFLQKFESGDQKRPILGGFSRLSEMRVAKDISNVLFSLHTPPFF